MKNKINKQMITLDEKRKKSMVSFLTHGFDFNQVSMFSSMSGGNAD